MIDGPDEVTVGLEEITLLLRGKADRSAQHTVNTVIDDDAGRIRARSRLVVVGYDAIVHARDLVDTVVRTPDGRRISRRQDRRRTRSASSTSDDHPGVSGDARASAAPTGRLEQVGPDDGYAILDVLAHYAHVIDNADWDELGSVFTPDVVFGGSRSTVRGWSGIAGMIGSVQPYYPHHTTDALLGARDDGTVRAWSKYFIVRDDGTAGSGDYLDTVVWTSDGMADHRPPCEPR